MRNLPFKDFEHNRVWLEIVRIAHDLLVLDPAPTAHRRARPMQSPSACATASCTSPAASHSTPAQQHYEYKPAGPGPAISPSRSSASERSPRPRADPNQPTPTTTSLDPARRAPAKPVHETGTRTATSTLNPTTTPTTRTQRTNTNQPLPPTRPNTHITQPSCKIRARAHHRSIERSRRPRSGLLCGLGHHGSRSGETRSSLDSV